MKTIDNAYIRVARNFSTVMSSMGSEIIPFLPTSIEDS